MTGKEVLIVGTGAMGCLFAAQLARFADITILGTWEEGLAAIENHGVRLVDIDGGEETFAVRVARSAEECPGVRVAIILVKSWQTRRVAEQLAHGLHPQGLALTLQNGLGNREILEDVLGRERVGIGVTTQGATLLEPGRVRAGGSGPVYFRPKPGMKSLEEVMIRAGFSMNPVEDIQGLLWGKLVVNAGINPLTALLDVPNGALLESAYVQEMMVAAAEETAAVAAALGVDLPFVSAADRVKEVARSTGENISSMLQDIRRGAPTEIEAISGAIVRQGERAGVPTPVNRVLWNLVRGKVMISYERDE